ncbi:hypothetical protein HPB49_013693 [Dermacentor silvarum]|uniref:Uncharacterized protein n=1 Tax=Dermacentor silvarum TaxID=543639 RepID=A0ACB8D5Y1_DERSI|nr:hypothetical protein HPB49_013693 [Dermacentor silvarum]
MALVLASALRSRMPGRAKGLAMDILAHALTELNSGRLPAFCAKFKVSFSAGSADDAGDASRPHLDDSRRDPCVVIENVMEESVGPQRRASDPLSAVGDCLLRSSTRKKSETRANSIVLSTARRLCRRGSGGSPYAEGHLDANASPLKDSRDKAHFDKGAGAQHGEPLQLDPAGTSGSLESVRDHEPLCSHRDYVLHSQAVFETYWKGNLHNILDVLKELTDRGSAELGWKRQGKLHEFTKAGGDSGMAARGGAGVDQRERSPIPPREPPKQCTVWWITQRHVAGNFLALYQKYDGASDQWLMSLREVDVHLLRTAIVHREIMECELQKVLRAADRELASSCCCLHEIFVKEGIGYWLAEHLDLIWSEFGNQVQKGVVNLHKAFDSSYLRAWASSLDANADEVAQSIHSAWTAFIGRVQESRRYVVEEETTRNARQDDMDMDTSSIPQRIYIYTSILRRYEELANHDWQVTYRSTIAILDQALSGGAVGGLSGACLSAVPVAHTKVMVIVTKIWEEVMVEIRQAFKECREKFEEAILVDHGL